VAATHGRAALLKLRVWVDDESRPRHARIALGKGCT